MYSLAKGPFGKNSLPIGFYDSLTDYIKESDIKAAEHGLNREILVPGRQNRKPLIEKTNLLSIFSIAIYTARSIYLFLRLAESDNYLYVK